MHHRPAVRALVALPLALALAATAHAAAPNLIVNGDFEAGNTDFTSGYGYTPGGNSSEGQYTVRSNPYPWNGAFVSTGDHTTGSGLMYVGNGSPVDGTTVWQSLTVTVTPNTNYYFEAWVTDVCCSYPFPGNTPSVLEFDVSGQSLGTATTDLALAGTWQGLSKTWNSGANTSVVLSLVNRNTGAAGNDFAIDDIYLGTESTVMPGVPEPTSVSLMLAGLALTGLYARRKRGAAGHRAAHA